jgi:hypothetical protein
MTEDISSNTAEIQQKKKPRGKPFVRGDERINKKGKPKSFDQLRKLAVMVASELDESGESRAIEILRDWARSKDAKKQELFMHYAYGKPKDELDLNVKEPVTLRVVYEEGKHGSGQPDNAAETAPEAK